MLGREEVHRYFVSLAVMAEDGRHGFVTAEVPRDKPITCLADIDQINELAKKQTGMMNATVLFWREFEYPAGGGLVWA